MALRLFFETGVLDKPIVNVELFGGWTRKFMPQGYIPMKEKRSIIKKLKLQKKDRVCTFIYILIHGFEGMAQDLPNRFELGGDGTIKNPGVRWYFDSIGGIRK